MMCYFEKNNHVKLEAIDRERRIAFQFLVLLQHVWLFDVGKVTSFYNAVKLLEDGETRPKQLRCCRVVNNKNWLH
jgi:hypothetical protein